MLQGGLGRILLRLLCLLPLFHALLLGLLLLPLLLPLGIIDRLHHLRTRRENRAQIPAFPTRLAVQVGNVLHIRRKTPQQLHTQIVMLHLTSTEHHRGLDTISLLNELRRSLETHGVIVIANFVTHLHLLDLRGLGILRLFLTFLLLHVSVLGVVDDLTHGRVGVGVDEDEIEPAEFLGLGKGVLFRHDAKGFVLAVLGGDVYAKFVLFDFIVHGRFKFWLFPSAASAAPSSSDCRKSCRCCQYFMGEWGCWCASERRCRRDECIRGGYRGCKH
mmetsp:Transcript_12278/g.21284  ORF Transcript_12278/g.21284 Transcript_12278/m.21284 type:complete len:274 (+) Transcript_12278:256-1077(+)